MTEFIAHDWCGFDEKYGRYTHMPSGKALVCQKWMRQADWDKAQLEFLKQFPGLNVHDCIGAYTTKGKLMGTTDEICERLQPKQGREKMKIQVIYEARATPETYDTLEEAKTAVH